MDRGKDGKGPPPTMTRFHVISMDAAKGNKSVAKPGPMAFLKSKNSESAAKGSKAEM